MTAQRKIIFWALAVLAFIGFVVLFNSILLPFVLGIAIAYLLNPVVNRLGRFGLNRGLAALVILGVFLLIVLTLAAVLTPLLLREISQFSQELPSYAARLEKLAMPLLGKVQEWTGYQDLSSLQSVLGENNQAVSGAAQTIATGLLAGGAAVFQLLSLLVIMPIVAYFMMKEWPCITHWVEDILPRSAKDKIMELFSAIDRKLAGFVRGQLSVALILGAAYAVALSIAGLKYGFLVGLGAGLLSVIPMVGSTIGLIAAVAMAWAQTGEWSFMAIVAGIFLAGQLIEGNFLTPKLVGDSVGLHPLWIFFALMAGGSLFGIVGMLLAVPVAAVVSVLAAFAIREYKASAYYKASTSSKNAPSKPRNQHED